jgi:hypothetical protein
MSKWENVLSPSPLERGWGEAKPSPPAPLGEARRRRDAALSLSNGALSMPEIC